jgi:mRNA-degrading endonuclease toxin of MazEF toxin-antitoxin module
VEESAASGQERNFGTGTIGVDEIRQLDQHPVGGRFGRGTPSRLRAVSKIL